MLIQEMLQLQSRRVKIRVHRGFVGVAGQSSAFVIVTASEPNLNSKDVKQNKSYTDTHQPYHAHV